MRCTTYYTYLPGSAGEAVAVIWDNGEEVGWSLSNRPGTAPKQGGQAGISSVPIDAWEYTKVPTRAACLLLLLLPMSVYV